MIIEMAEYQRLLNSGRVTLSADEEDRILEMARRIASNRIRRVSIKSPDDLRKYLRNYYYGRQDEQFGVVWLDTRHNIIEFEPALFKGTIDAAAVYPRVVVREALKHNASACILTHNHPSGCPKPSSADIELTKRLKDVLGVIDVRVLDHMVCGADEVSSLAELGCM